LEEVDLWGYPVLLLIENNVGNFTILN
jgi:hypothetical protein